MRLDKFLSNLKYGTRSEVQSKIKKGFVTVNGVTVKDSKTQINPEEDDIIIDGETTYYKKTILLIMNKPAIAPSTTVLWYDGLRDIIKCSTHTTNNWHWR